nr:23S rRNA (pseudouridine(1915)-N(3))-methyltransferase RlmH [Nitratireductor luteus]
MIHAVGRMKVGPERELADRFLDRLQKSGPAVGIEFSGVIECAESRAQSPNERKREEGRKLNELAEAGVTILLDERGKNISSRALAEMIARYRNEGVKQVTFAIGGPDGHDDEARATAELAISFGAQTWPHQLMRIMLAEQLYRSVTILAGHPYHRD